MNQIINIISPGSYQRIPGSQTEHPGSNAKRNIIETSSKYILENNMIVFERYDRYGKLISRVNGITVEFSVRFSQQVVLKTSALQLR